MEFSVCENNMQHWHFFNSYAKIFFRIFRTILYYKAWNYLNYTAVILNKIFLGILYFVFYINRRGKLKTKQKCLNKHFTSLYQATDKNNTLCFIHIHYAHQSRIVVNYYLDLEIIEMNIQKTILREIQFISLSLTLKTSHENTW